MGKNQKKIFFFDFWHQNDSIREKKAKKNFELFDPKKFYHPRWGDPQWAKIKKKIFIFGIRMTQFAKISNKKNFDPKFGPGMSGMWPKRGSK